MSRYSVNTWIILINVAVFVVDALLGASGVFDSSHRGWEIGVSPAPPVQRLALGSGIARDAATGQLFRPIIDRATGSVVGRAIFQPRSKALGLTEVWIGEQRLVDPMPDPKFLVVDPWSDVFPRTIGTAAPFAGQPYRDIYDSRTGTRVGSVFFRPMRPLEAMGHFSTLHGFLGLQVWRLITYQFLHANVLHVFFNMFGLFIFGSMVEEHLGRQRYLAYYLACGAFGGISYLLLNFLASVLHVPLPGFINVQTWTPLIGASAGVFGVLMACAYIAPNAVVQLLFPPIPLKMKWLVYGYLGMAVYNLITGGHNAGGDAAHVGGAIAGWYLIRHAHLLRDFFDVLGDSRKPGQAPGPRRHRAGREHTPRRQAEVDRILAKVATQGLHSLTERERRTLRRETES